MVPTTGCAPLGTARTSRRMSWLRSAFGSAVSRPGLPTRVRPGLVSASRRNRSRRLPHELPNFARISAVAGASDEAEVVAGIPERVQVGVEPWSDGEYGPDRSRSLAGPNVGQAGDSESDVQEWLLRSWSPPSWRAAAGREREAGAKLASALRDREAFDGSLLIDKSLYVAVRKDPEQLVEFRDENRLVYPTDVLLVLRWNWQ